MCVGMGILKRQAAMRAVVVKYRKAQAPEDNQRGKSGVGLITRTGRVVNEVKNTDDSG